ncbi:maleylpyruvate isomerase family mycothiol-dependent enzyme [Actinoplanes sp. NBRC 103695]|uniref:maleylpyruvate isomerase family mycothiol-dependent enzyme n=1 Tax=Actinoplanes sp. NBRC 103695 TaxID=3032202 RepID=UPI0024A41E37|nr:maleylpyruvate isomerase family mycothiol-dependent enzyme [Actinoplanes sp. NBRC 103695]GLZ00161.1 maleylpyruvate isomerase [Actinoplanes sp. NBRC 103695]
MSRAWSEEWAREGTALFLAAVAGLTDEQLREPSALPGWTRAHVVAHLARNADALINLLEWARTGVETPMYSGPEQRDGDIERGAKLPAAELRADLLRSAERFAKRVAEMPAEAWQGEVRTRQGRLIRGAEVLWMRSREVWVHQADLGTGITFGNFPADFLVELIGDVTGSMTGPSVRIEAGEHTWTVGDGSPTVSGTPAAVAAWLTGRTAGDDLHGARPELPGWL